MYMCLRVLGAFPLGKPWRLNDLPEFRVVLPELWKTEVAWSTWGIKMVKPECWSAREWSASEVCRGEGGRKQTNKKTSKQNKKILRIHLPAILKSDFHSVSFLTTYNQLILVLFKAGVWPSLLVPSCICFSYWWVPVCSVAFMLVLVMAKKSCSFTSGKCVGRVPLCGDTENVILFTEGLKEHLFEGNGGIPDFSPGFGLCLIKKQEQHFRHLYFAYIFFFLPFSLPIAFWQG